MEFESRKITQSRKYKREQRKMDKAKGKGMTLASGVVAGTLLFGAVGAGANYILEYYTGEGITDNVTNAISEFVTNTNERIATLEADLLQANTDKQTLTTEKNQLQSQVEMHEQTMIELNNRIAELESNGVEDGDLIESLRTQLEEATNNYNSTLELYNQKVTELATANETIASLQSELAELQEENEQLKADLNIEIGEVQKANSDVTQLEEDVNEILGNGAINQPSNPTQPEEEQLPNDPDASGDVATNPDGTPAENPEQASGTVTPDAGENEAPDAGDETSIPEWDGVTTVELAKGDIYTFNGYTIEYKENGVTVVTDAEGTQIYYKGGTSNVKLQNSSNFGQRLMVNNSQAVKF